MRRAGSDRPIERGEDSRPVGTGPTALRFLATNYTVESLTKHRSRFDNREGLGNMHDMYGLWDFWLVWGSKRPIRTTTNEGKSMYHLKLLGILVGLACLSSLAVAKTVYTKQVEQVAPTGQVVQVESAGDASVSEETATDSEVQISQNLAASENVVASEKQPTTDFATTDLTLAAIDESTRVQGTAVELTSDEKAVLAIAPVLTAQEERAEKAALAEMFAAFADVRDLTAQEKESAEEAVFANALASMVPPVLNPAVLMAAADSAAADKAAADKAAADKAAADKAAADKAAADKAAADKAAADKATADKAAADKAAADKAAADKAAADKAAAAKKAAADKAAADKAAADKAAAAKAAAAKKAAADKAAEVALSTEKAHEAMDSLAGDLTASFSPFCKCENEDSNDAFMQRLKKGLVYDPAAETFRWEVPTLSDRQLTDAEKAKFAKFVEASLLQKLGVGAVQFQRIKISVKFTSHECEPPKPPKKTCSAPTPKKTCSAPTPKTCCEPTPKTCCEPRPTCCQPRAACKSQSSDCSATCKPKKACILTTLLSGLCEKRSKNCCQ